MKKLAVILISLLSIVSVFMYNNNVEATSTFLLFYKLEPNGGITSANDPTYTLYLRNDAAAGYTEDTTYHGVYNIHVERDAMQWKYNNDTDPYYGDIRPWAQEPASYSGLPHTNPYSALLISSVVIDNEIKPTSTAYWFAGTSITTAPTNMSTNLNTSNVTDMSYMFFACSELDGTLDLSSFNTSNVTNMKAMFSRAHRIESFVFSSFNTSKVTDMSEMFFGDIDLTALDLSYFDTSKVTDMHSMFKQLNLSSLTLSSLNTSSLIDMSTMFYNSTNLLSLDLSTFNTSNVTNMSGAFAFCSSLQSVNLTNINTSKVTNMNGLFGNCSSLLSLDLSYFDTSKVTNMETMFAGCSTLSALDLTTFNTSKVTTMKQMFAEANGIVNLDLSSFDTSSVTNMENMFASTTGNALTILDLANFTTPQVTTMKQMFAGCANLTTIKVGADFNTSSLIDDTNMFYYCNSLQGGNGTNYTSMTTLDTANCNTKKYARLDTVDNLGYFTFKQATLTPAWPPKINNTTSHYSMVNTSCR